MPIIAVLVVDPGGCYALRPTAIMMSFMDNPGVTAIAVPEDSSALG